MSVHTNTKGASLSQAVKKGIAWNLSGRVVIFLISLGTSIVLARLLEPEDFGTYGMALIFAGLASRFGDVGFGLALIQRKEIQSEHVSSCFVASVLLFVTLTVVTISVSPLVGLFFENPLAGRVLSILSLTFLASPFSSVARVLLQRQMDFRGVATANIVDHVAVAVTCIGFAWQGQGVWSLVYGQLAGTLLRTLVLLTWAGWKPNLRFRLQAFRDLFSFGFNIFLKNLLIYGSDKVDYLITGKQFGPGVLGMYEKAFNLMDITVKEMSAKIGSGVLFSAFSKIQEDQTRLRAAYMKIILTLSLVCFPVFSGLFVVAPSVIYVCFGEKWLPSAVPLQILCIAGILRMYLQITSTAINAMGYVATEVWMRGAALLLLGVGCWIGSFWGIAGVSTAVTLTTGVLAVSITSYFFMLTDLSITEFVWPQIPAAVSSLVMTATVLAYQRWLGGATEGHSAVTLLCSVGVGVISYVGTLLLLRPASVMSLLSELTADLKLMLCRTTQ